MTYNITQYYGENPREELKKDYCVDSLTRDLNNAIEDLAEINKYLTVLKEQLVRAKSTPLKYYVEFKKEHNYSTKHINYFAYVYQLPDIPDARKNARSIAVYRNDYKERGTVNHPFLGNEKKDAIAYVLALSKEYGGCEIVGNAADLVKPAKGVLQI